MGDKKEIPMFWPTTENVEQLKKTLALLICSGDLSEAFAKKYDS